jgi:UDP:flavonoid glycosyltransferase YjiC (YdhE family)
MGENATRVAWSGAGLMVPRPLLDERPVRWAVRRVLGDPRFSARAKELARWAKENDGAERGADLVEDLARG